MIPGDSPILETFPLFHHAECLQGAVVLLDDSGYSSLFPFDHFPLRWNYIFVFFGTREYVSPFIILRGPGGAVRPVVFVSTWRSQEGSLLISGCGFSFFWIYQMCLLSSCGEGGCVVWEQGDLPVGLSTCETLSLSSYVELPENLFSPRVVEIFFSMNKTRYFPL